MQRKVDDDYEREKGSLDKLYDEGERLSRAIKRDEDNHTRAKQEVNDLKKVVGDKNAEIGEYIDQKDADIDSFSNELKDITKTQKDFKFRIEEAKGAIAGMVMEKEKLEFDRIKYSLHGETDAEDSNKEFTMRQLEHRLNEANDATRRLNDQIKAGPPKAIEINSVDKIDSRDEREARA